MKLIQSLPLPELCTIDEMRAFLSSSAEQDVLVTSLMASATSWIEEYTCSQFGERPASLYYDSFEAGLFDLGVKAVADVTGIDYFDSDNASQSLVPANFQTDAPISPHIFPLVGDYWPATYARPNAVKVEVVLGTTDVPPDVKLAQRLLVMQSWDDVDNDMAIKSQLAPHVWRY